jgi:predicted ABC-type ATPase
VTEEKKNHPAEWYIPETPKFQLVMLQFTSLRKNTRDHAILRQQKEEVGVLRATINRGTKASLSEQVYQTVISKRQQHLEDLLVCMSLTFSFKNEEQFVATAQTLFEPYCQMQDLLRPNKLKISVDEFLVKISRTKMKKNCPELLQYNHKPEAHFIVGGPGAGKSNLALYVKTLFNEDDNISYVNPDWFKKAVEVLEPEVDRRSLNIKLQKNYHGTKLRKAGERITNRTLDQWIEMTEKFSGPHLVLDATLISRKLASFREKSQRSVHVWQAWVDPQIALIRVKERALKENRFVSSSATIERHRKQPELALQAVRDFSSELTVMDMSGEKPRLILEHTQAIGWDVKDIGKAKAFMRNERLASHANTNEQLYNGVKMEDMSFDDLLVEDSRIRVSAPVEKRFQGQTPQLDGKIKPLQIPRSTR